MTIRALAFPFALAVLPAATAAGQSRQIPAAAQSRPVIITSATVHTVTGPSIDDGYVVFDNGLILEVGQGGPPAVRNAELINASGPPTYAGPVSPDPSLGLV